MIHKELDELTANDKYAAAGRKAEEKMAFYLKRFFQTADDIHVLNGIRLERDGDAAQMDHLLIHPFGLIIVESKSVAGKVQIKDDGQWLRWYGNESRGMASPITQARLQAEFLRAELGRATGRADLFKTIPVELLVAISDDGVILWPKSGPLPVVCKADQVADKVRARVAEFTTAGASKWFVGGNLPKICEFLKKAHKPLPVRESKPIVAEPPVPPYVPAKSAPPPEPAAVEPPATIRSCAKCGSAKLEIRNKFSYYFHCNDCGNNTNIKETCPNCGEPAKIRKKGKAFFLDCAKCSTSRPYFVNGEGAES
jgi:ssDNA-binding Zn-finger/Zn-ribbon topoisomerase 1